MAIENLITDHLDLWTAAVRPKSSAGRGSNSKLELTGIKKLRELILELAVRGKLVPQDPSDEPASVLLERIAAEKARLVKEEGLRTSANEVVDIADEYIECPSHWKWIRLGNIAKFIDYRGKTPNKIDAGVRLITAKNIRYGYIDLVPEEFISEADYEQWMTRGFPRVGDTLFTTEAPLGNAAVIDINERFALAQRAICFQWHYSAISRFMLIQILASPFQNQLLDNSSGMTATGVKASRLKEIPVVVPPVEEQHRIVAKVDELMALCDQLELCSESQLAAHQTLVETLLVTLTDSCDADELAQNWARLSTHFDILFTTEASIDALKQSILQLAVMGKLVPQDPSDEPASALLERIAAEKARLVKEKKIKKEKPLPAISENEKPFELPQGWEWCHLKDIITIMDAGWSPACPPESSPDIDTWGVLKTTAVQTLEYREYENKVLDKTKTPRPEYEVMVGDILITRAGPKNRVGISCLVEKTRPKLMISDKIIRFHLVEVGLSERFISLCLNAGATAVYIDDSKSGMAESQMNISQDKLKLAPIPLGPIKEQNHIMDRVDQLMTLCDQLKVCLQTSQQTQLALAESLVEGALA
ncbi:restriction endonuclease subunit S [Aeromonas dhakensis]|uniref:restriction endonuclease subunit S n=1 Tax=Aeromonas dhakensis TaxID=196024 RepID=UPI001C5B8A4E|nr:restriction endonuclease subunit S [Aeromonas dhakensis]MBW3692646.1 restriction endonuclease subunit S [Aeromonas dhakensis]